MRINSSQWNLTIRTLSFRNERALHHSISKFIYRLKSKDVLRIEMSDSRTADILVSPQLKFFTCSIALLTVCDETLADLYQAALDCHVEPRLRVNNNRQKPT